MIGIGKNKRIYALSQPLRDLDSTLQENERTYEPNREPTRERRLRTQAMKT